LYPEFSQTRLREDIFEVLKRWQDASVVPPTLTQLHLVHRRSQLVGATYYPAIVEIIRDSLDLLAYQEQRLAQLLRLRYLEGASVFDACRVFNVAESTLYSLQKEAIDRLTQVTDPLGLQTHYRYPDPAKEPLTAEHPIEITDAQGGVKRLQWSRLGLLTQYTDCSGHSTVYRYDTRGRLLQVSDAQGHSLRYERDRTGQVQAVHHPDGSQTHYQWDSQGRLLKETNAQGQSAQNHVQYQYDSNGRVLQVQRVTPQAGQSPHTSALRYQWDVAGRLTRLTNEAGEHTHFEYDAADQLTAEIGFDARTQRY
jgi:YD repeat-containing protein